MGEIVLNHLVQERLDNSSPSISRIDSCGTIDYHAGDNPDPRCLETAKRFMGPNIQFSKSRKIRKTDFQEFDYILCCDRSNLEDVKSLKRKWKIGTNSTSTSANESGPVLALVGDWDPQNVKEMHDPYYDRGSSGFEENYRHAERSLQVFLESLESSDLEE